MIAWIRGSEGNDEVFVVRAFALASLIIEMPLDQALMPWL